MTVVGAPSIGTLRALWASQKQIVTGRWPLRTIASKGGANMSCGGARSPPATTRRSSHQKDCPPNMLRSIASCGAKKVSSAWSDCGVIAPDLSSRAIVV